jgi:6-phosphogluconolactonase
MIQRFDNLAAFVASAAALIHEELRAQAAAGWFSLALAGGSTPIPVYRSLAETWRRHALPWQRGLIVPGDERLVAEDDPRRNDGMIRDTLFTGLPDAEDIFLPLLGEDTHVYDERTAVAAENRLRAVWHGELTPEGLPCFGLILLGLGTDGHTASLFADSPALGNTNRWVMAVPPPHSAEPQIPRLTLTEPVIRAARRAVFLVAGDAKVDLAERILGDSAAAYPAGRVRPPATCDWLLVRSSSRGTA